MPQRLDSSSRSIPTRNLIRAPSVAWATLLLTGMILFAWTWIGWKAFFDGLSLWVAFGCNTLLAYMAFTPQHE
ncbi:MAG: hypothetical protein ACKVJH_10265, partial [Flavobacteriales bacterium]